MLNTVEITQIRLYYRQVDIHFIRERENQFKDRFKIKVAEIFVNF